MANPSPSPTTLEELGEAYDHFFPKIYRFLYYRTNEKEIAEDLTSQTFLKAIEKFHLFSPKKGTFNSWIYRIARNTLTDHYRTNKKTLNIEDIISLSTDEDIPNKVQTQLNLEELQEALKSLNETQRDIVIMRVWDDLPYQEIAAIVGKTESNCKVIFGRAVNKLQTQINVSTTLLSILIPLT
ncbi:RNA polymerase sigma factor [Candidatus Peregrinibacteria bacterium]|jgi:RNA polymerase sigma-70 factor, ECF subfamily|nr:RNA polymerase sigma factor [Candidatus Peregrinibacteria bacterium]MBT7484087.1 RNA polymerase sigma factor [Candidatus Peregrinibacteria bacterium]MBT7703195.1 RNA polymerase sigma factor [Candidatus Peregrinibacteria bacterium]